MVSHVITGGAGFIGTNLAQRLLARGEDVLLLDDLSLGSMANVARLDAQVRFDRVDCADAAAIRAALDRCGIFCPDQVWHLAANSDIAAGTDDFRVDLQRTFLTTVGVLEAMQGLGPARLHFASSSAIYGEMQDRPAAEGCGPLEPISYYGAMKLASEAQIRAAVENFLPGASVFRFANIVGTPATHGVVLDFVRRLLDTPDQLVVRGDGTQRKPYLHVDELVDAMLFAVAHADGRYNVFNVGPADAGVSVAAIAEIVVAAVAPGAAIRFGSERRGWVGDVPKVRLVTTKLAQLGWTARMDSEAAVRLAVGQIAEAAREHR